jgi:hypothetical protein
MDVVFTSVPLPGAVQDYACVGVPGQHVMAITTATEKGIGVALVNLDTGASRTLIEDAWPPVSVLA